jgi:TatD DNase family protein
MRVMVDSMLVDTHAHLCDSVFDGDLGDVLERARKAGIVAVIAVSENISDAEKNLLLASRHPMIRPAAGLYPTEPDAGKALEMTRFIKAHRDRLVAIGEVGLDYWIVKEEEQRDLQREILRGFVDVSRELDLPLNVHSRSAGRQTIDLLLNMNAAKVHMHAFDGKASNALPAVEAGFYFSIPPSIVHSNQKQKLVKHLPLSSLLIETDSPVLGPNRKERNEPANALIAVEAISELKSITVNQVIEAIEENTRSLYGEL